MSELGKESMKFSKKKEKEGQKNNIKALEKSASYLENLLCKNSHL